MGGQQAEGRRARSKIAGQRRRHPGRPAIPMSCPCRHGNCTSTQAARRMRVVSAPHLFLSNMGPRSFEPHDLHPRTIAGVDRNPLSPYYTVGHAHASHHRPCQEEILRTSFQHNDNGHLYTFFLPRLLVLVWTRFRVNSHLGYHKYHASSQDHHQPERPTPNPTEHPQRDRFGSRHPCAMQPSALLEIVVLDQAARIPVNVQPGEPEERTLTRQTATRARPRARR
jgi:hypothetical protein